MFWTIFTAVLAALVTQQLISWLFFMIWWHDWSLFKPKEPAPMATYKETDHA